MPKLTMDDVDKKIEEILIQAEPVERAGVVSSLIERMRARVRPAGIPPVRTPRLPRI